MKLSKVVAKHGFKTSQLGEINKAKLYERTSPNSGATELLCVQKIGNVFKVDTIELLNFGSMVLPMGGRSSEIIPRDDLEGYLNSLFEAAASPHVEYSKGESQ